MSYTNGLDDPSAYFQVATYTGTGATQSVGNDGNSNLKPDLVWIKKRNATGNNSVFDSTRGAYQELVTNGTNAEATDVQLLTQFDTDGFTVGTNGGVNGSGDTFVGWQWKANGGTTSSNTDGSLTSTVQANQDAGFSIVTFTTDGTTKTVGHGLGVKPDIVLVKSRNVAGSWLFITDIVDGSMDYGVLNSSNAFSAIGYDAPTSSVFSYNDNDTNTQVAYCFASKQGYSKFGKYVGNGNGNGPFVYTGFKPAFLLFKRVENSRSWVIIDNKRDPYNVATKRLFPDLDSGDNVLADLVDLVSNGFKVRQPNVIINGSAEKYIYMAFAENPFVTSTGIPTTAR